MLKKNPMFMVNLIHSVNTEPRLDCQRHPHNGPLGSYVKPDLSLIRNLKLTVNTAHRDVLFGQYSFSSFSEI